MSVKLYEFSREIFRKVNHATYKTMGTTCCVCIALLLLLKTGAPTYGSDCGAVFVQRSGVITFPQYPGFYGDNITCFWNLTGPENEVLEMRFSKLNLEHGFEIINPCSDYVNIYDGDTVDSSIIKTMCGIMTPEQLATILIRSSKNKMLIQFHSNARLQGQGFEAKFWSQVCPIFTYGSEACNQTCNCVREKTSYCNSTNGVCVCKPGWTGSNCSQDVDECSNRTVETCPIDYQECVNTPGGFICQCLPGLTETDIQLRKICAVNASHNCSSEHNCSHLCAKVQHREQCYCPDNMKLMGRTCQACDNLTFGKECSLRCSCESIGTQSCNLTTGGCVCHEGWTSANCSVDIDECQLIPRRVCTARGEVCKNLLGNYTCETINCSVSDLSVVVKDVKGMVPVSSSNIFCDNITYSWTIVTDNPGMVISFRLNSLKFEHYQSERRWQRRLSPYSIGVHIYDGNGTSNTLLAQYHLLQHGSRTQTIWSSGSTMHIVFKASTNSTPYKAWFEGNFAAVGYKVNTSKLTTPSGRLMSAGYPFHHSYNVSQWLIEVPNYNFTTISFSDTYISGDCTNTYLRTIDPAESNVQHTWCQNTHPGTNVTARLPVLIVYNSGGNNEKGFHASYRSCNCSFDGTMACGTQNDSCLCKANFTGTHCETQIDPCVAHSCPNQSNCLSEYNSVRCVCWSGEEVPSNGTCDDVLRVLTNQSGYFESLPSSSRTNYTWIILGKPGSVISIRFSYFNMTILNVCLFSVLTIFEAGSDDIKLIGQFCGWNAPAVISLPRVHVW